MIRVLKYLVFILLSSLSAKSQIYIKPNNSYGLIYNRIRLDSTLFIPTGCGAPVGTSSLRSTNQNMGALYFDLCGKKTYTFNPTDSSWATTGSATQITDSSFIVGRDTIVIRPGINASDTSNKWVNNVYLRSDSLFKYKNSIETLITPIPSEWVSVTDFGAKANDTLIDYTSNIQTALNSGARTVLVPAGVYIITDILKINSFQTLLAYGAKFKRAANTTAILMNNADGITGGYGANTNISVLGLTIDGNASLYTGNCTLIAFGHCTNVTIRDCDLSNTPTWHLTEINGCKNTLIENCNYHDAILSNRECIQTDLQYNSGAFPWFGPFDSTSIDGLTIRHCTFKNSNNGIGQHAVIDNRPIKNLTIENCWFENLSETAIRPYNYNNCIIRNNTIINCQQGIRDYTSYDNPFKLNRGYIIEGNTIVNLTQSSTEGRGINLRFVKNIIISNNIIDSVRRHGIGVDWCDTFLISNNIIKRYGAGWNGDGFGIAAWGSKNGVINANSISCDSISKSLYPFSNRDAILTNIAGGYTPKNISITDNNIYLPFSIPPNGLQVSNPSAFNQRYGLLGDNIYVGHNIINDTSVGNTKMITANYTISGTEGVISANTTSGNITITLLPRLLNDGITIIKSGGSNTLTVTPSSGAINGASSITVDSVVTLKSDGFNYYITAFGSAGGNGIYTGSGSLTTNTIVSGAGNSLSLGASGDKLSSLTTNVTGTSTYNSDAHSFVDGSGNSFSMGAGFFIIAGSLNLRVDRATDANLSMTTSSCVMILPAITANRTLSLPASAREGMVYIIINLNSSGNTWQFGGGGSLVDQAGAAVTSFANNTSYIIVGDNSANKYRIIK